MSEITPLVVPLRKTFANDKGSLLYSISVSFPTIAPVCAMEIEVKKMNKRLKTLDHQNFLIIFCF